MALTNCDPARPNGQLSIIIDGGIAVSNYDIEWYAGNTPSGPVLAITDILIGQSAGIYTVSVTNSITQCVTTINGTIEAVSANGAASLLPPQFLSEIAIFPKWPSGNDARKINGL